MQTALIIGAGTVGPLLALALKKTGKFSPILFDAVPQFKDIGGGIQIAPNGIKLLTKLGLTDQFLSIGAPVNQISINTIPDASIITSFTTESWKKLYNSTNVGVKRTTMNQLFMDAVMEADIPFHPNHRLSTISQPENDTVVATFSNGTSFTGNLLIGCDGLHSVTRSLIFGPDSTRYTNTIATIGISPLSNLPVDQANIWMGNGKQFGSYPISSTEILWFIAQDEPDESKAKESWSSTENLSQISSQLVSDYPDLPPIPRQLVTSSTRIIRYGIFDRIPLKTWSKGNVTLLGDAAHPMSPHIGQGANTAMEDVHVLSLLLEKLPVTEAFQIYQELRIPRTTAIVNSAKQMGESYKLTNPLACYLRNLVIKLLVYVNSTPPVGSLYSYDAEKIVRDKLSTLAKP